MSVRQHRHKWKSLLETLFGENADPSRFKSAVKGLEELAEGEGKHEKREAKWVLGWCYECGRGVEKDSQQAGALYEESKNEGSIIGSWMRGHWERGEIDTFSCSVEKESLKKGLQRPLSCRSKRVIQ